MIKNIILFFALVSLTTVCSTAQTVKSLEKPKEKKVKEKAWLKVPEPPSATITAAWAPVEVDNYIGIRGGYGMGNARFEPQRNTLMYMGLINFGLWYRFDVPKQKYVGCIEVDLEYLEKGYQFETYNDSEIYTGRKYSTIMLPILWQPYLPLGKGGSRFYLNAGPFFSYAVASTQFVYAKGEKPVQKPYKYDMLIDNRWEYGITAGAGFIFSIKKFRLGIDFRYNITLSDTFIGVTKNLNNKFFRSPVDQMNISVSLGYKLPSAKKKKTAETQN